MLPNLQNADTIISLDFVCHHTAELDRVESSFVDQRPCTRH
jgi:hypothetical protein